ETMRKIQLSIVISITAAVAGVASAQDSARAPVPPADSIAQLVARLDLEHYKATLKGLTQFGDRRQGTARNRAAVDWIEQQLRSYGCNDVSRLTYEYAPPSSLSPEGRGGQGVRPGGQGERPASGGGRYRGIRARTGVNTDSLR